eukprot:3940293-Rhodomonas_salina.3
MGVGAGAGLTHWGAPEAKRVEDCMHRHHVSCHVSTNPAARGAACATYVLPPPNSVRSAPYCSATSVHLHAPTLRHLATLTQHCSPWSSRSSMVADSPQWSVSSADAQNRHHVQSGALIHGATVPMRR